MSKELRGTSTGLVVGDTTIPRNDTLSTNSIGVGGIRFVSFWPRLEVGASSSTRNVFSAWSCGSTSNADGAIWASANQLDGKDRLYVAHGGLKYSFLSWPKTTTYSFYNSYSRNAGIGWGSTIEYYTPPVPSGQKLVLTDIYFTAYGDSGSNGSDAIFVYQPPTGAEISILNVDARGYTSSDTYTNIINPPPNSTPSTQYICVQGGRFAIRCRINGSGAAYGKMEFRGCLVPASTTLPLVR